MQRLHPDDLVGHLLEEGGWTHLNLPAIAETECSIALGNNRYHHRRIGDLLHPERENEAALHQLKISMGSMEFSAQYQQAPVPLGGNLIKWSWFKFYNSDPNPRPGDSLIVSWDTAMSSNQLADFSVCVVLLVRGETVYVLDVTRARLEYPDLKRAVLSNHRRWRQMAPVYSLLIEKKGSGLSFSFRISAATTSMPSAWIRMATKSCAWSLRRRRSRPAPSIFHCTRPGLMNLKRSSCHFPRAGMTTKSTLCHKACNMHSPQNRQLQDGGSMGPSYAAWVERIRRRCVSPKMTI
jgi:hypothetical protein